MVASTAAACTAMMQAVVNTSLYYHYLPSVSDDLDKTFTTCYYCLVVLFY